MRATLALLTLLAALAACSRSHHTPPAPSRALAVAPRFADADPHDWTGPLPWQYPVHGIDVSRYQGDVDWFRVRGSGVAFAYLKATEGGDYADDHFPGNWAGARSAGVARGAYHYYYFCRTALEQAAWFMNHVPRDSSALPPVLDLEWNHRSKTCTLRPDPATVRSEAQTFLRALKILLRQGTPDLHDPGLLPRQRTLAPRRHPLLAPLRRRPPVRDLPGPALGALAVHRHRDRRRHRRADRPQRLRRLPDPARLVDRGRRPVTRLRRHLLPLLLLLAALLSVLHVFDWLSRPLLRPLDTRAEAVAEGIALRAGAAFALSKTINAALSFAEDVTVSGSAVFVQASAQPGAILKPVNNLVDQFARIMLVVAAGALLIEILLHIGAGYGASLLLALPLLALAALALARGTRWAPRLRRLAWGTAVLAVVVRLALPLALLATGAVSDRFLSDRYAAATAGLGDLEAKSAAAAAAAQIAEEKSWTQSVTDGVKSTFAMIGETFTGTFHDVVTMVTVFFVETVLLPLLLVLALWRGLAFLVPRPQRA